MSPVPPGEVGWLQQLLDQISQNPQVVAVYVGSSSALIALLSALVALKQSYTSRESLKVTQFSLEETREQARIARRSLAQLETSARHERLNVYAPVVTPVLLRGLDYVFVPGDPNERSGPGLREQFNAAKKTFDPSVPIELDLAGLDYERPDHVWLGGTLLFRNEGPTSAIVTPWRWHYERVDGDPIIDLGNDAFLIEPGANVTIFWIRVFLISMWLERAEEAYVGVEEGRPDPRYCFKHLGERGQQDFFSIESPAVPRLSDNYQAHFEFLPLTDDGYRNRKRKGIYKVGRNPVRVNLEKRFRIYPDESHDSVS